MAGTSRKAQLRKFEVLLSFSGLDKGLVFEQPADDLGWASLHVQSGYLRDVTEEEPDAGRGADDQG